MPYLSNNRRDGKVGVKKNPSEEDSHRLVVDHIAHKRRQIADIEYELSVQEKRKGGCRTYSPYNENSRYVVTAHHRGQP